MSSTLLIKRKPRRASLKRGNDVLLNEMHLERLFLFIDINGLNSISFATIPSRV